MNAAASLARTVWPWGISETNNLTNNKIYLWVVCYTRRRKATSSGKNLRRSISLSHSSTSTCVVGAGSLIKWNLWLLGDLFVSVRNFTRRYSDYCLKMETVCLVSLKFRIYVVTTQRSTKWIYKALWTSGLADTSRKIIAMGTDNPIGRVIQEERPLWGKRNLSSFNKHIYRSVLVVIGKSFRSLWLICQLNVLYKEKNYLDTCLSMNCYRSTAFLTF